MTKEHWGWAIWYGGWIALYFGIAESLAILWSGCPWSTFSTTTMSLQARWDFLTIPVIAVLALLFAHLPLFKNVQAGTLAQYHDEVAKRHTRKSYEHFAKAKSLRDAA